MSLRSHFELVSFLLTGRELIEVVIKAGGKSLESSQGRSIRAVKALIRWEYLHIVLTQKFALRTALLSLSSSTGLSHHPDAKRSYSAQILPFKAWRRNKQRRTAMTREEINYTERLWLLEVTSLECYLVNDKKIGHLITECLLKLQLIIMLTSSICLIRPSWGRVFILMHQCHINLDFI